MGFRQNNKKTRVNNLKWDTFREANWGLIEQVGLPLTTVETFDRFYDLLNNGYLDFHDDPLKFSIHQLSPLKYMQFRKLVLKYFEAGFSGWGMPAWLVGQREFLRLVRKYPTAFSENEQKRADEMISTAVEEWWLDSSALPDLLWARLTVYRYDSADILDLAGELHEFWSSEEAKDWLRESQYDPMDSLIDYGLLPPATMPPSAAADGELVPKMVVRVDMDE